MSILPFGLPSSASSRSLTICTNSRSRIFGAPIPRSRDRHLHHRGGRPAVGPRYTRFSRSCAESANTSGDRRRRCGRTGSGGAHLRDPVMTAHQPQPRHGNQQLRRLGQWTVPVDQPVDDPGDSGLVARRGQAPIALESQPVAADVVRRQVRVDRKIDPDFLGFVGRRDRLPSAAAR